MWYMFQKDEIATAWKKLTIGNLENLLEKSWNYVVLYKRSFVFFLCALLAIACFFHPWFDVISKIVVPIMVFIISLLMILRVFRQFQIQSQNLERQAENTQKQIAAEQFKNAIDHLGEDKQAVVLGGVHALHNLAVNFPEDYSKQVFEVLCSFLREATVDPLYQAKVKAKLKAEEKKPTNTEESQPSDGEEQKLDATSAPRKKLRQRKTTSLIVIQTIVDKLFRYKNPEESVYRDHKTEQYYKADLTGAFLPKVNLRHANLHGAKLEDANLQGADLSIANLQGADLSIANLQWAALVFANRKRQHYATFYEPGIARLSP